MIYTSASISPADPKSGIPGQTTNTGRDGPQKIYLRNFPVYALSPARKATSADGKVSSVHGTLGNPSIFLGRLVTIHFLSPRFARKSVPSWAELRNVYLCELIIY
ncbi:hypothetical protein ASPBRDRAFT_561346 [Aspergillus brasiliensis CBS 101740]|uniref:Uncharacterized protein n=1 Tax=Aspergillus brasiliensis (strain CBS 101740 / IMI 381727 / IBT 21946) TaxID=767769 RepID=A0A1L9UN80_ASPBC|nr:hypothetical protein ASPBRDRAFT_561346 [Aspergillus brasiliensis CBS 101740]